MRALPAGLCGALSLTLVVGSAHVPASADEPDTTTVVVESGQPAGAPSVGTVQVVSTPIGIEVTNPGSTSPLPPQCTQIPHSAGQHICVGAPSSLDSGGSSIELRAGAGAWDRMGSSALRLLEEEAVAMLAAKHGILDRSTIRTYARPEIRAYMVLRLIDILDRRLYGVELTATEQSVFEALRDAYIANDAIRAEQMYAEYLRWAQDPCNFPVPNPPAGFEPIPNPIATSTTCQVPHGGLGALWQTSYHVPPAEVFQAWATYRNPGLLADAAHRAAIDQGIVHTVAALGVMFGTGVAAAAVAGIYSVIVAMGLSAAQAVAGVLGVLSFTMPKIAAAAAAGETFVAFSGGQLVTAGTATAGAAASAAAVVGVVLTAAILIAMTTWKFVEDENAIARIKDLYNAATDNDDPFGIEELRPAYAGLNYAEREVPQGAPAPPHHDPAFLNGLLARVAEWTMFDALGNFVPDPVPGGGEDGPDGPPLHFTETDGSAATQAVTLRPAQPMTDAQGREVTALRVRAAGGWLWVAHRVDGSWVNEHRQLAVPYLTPGGVPAVMSIIQARDDDGRDGPRFQLSVFPTGDATGEHQISETWSFQDMAGGNLTRRLAVDPPLTPRMNVLPTASGTLRLDTNVHLLSNASAPTWSLDDRAYSWTLSRLEGQSWVEVPLPEEKRTAINFSHRITASGTYRAVVTLTGTDPVEGAISTAGAVEFVVHDPDPEVLHAELEPTGNGGILLDLHLREERATDIFTVDVDWGTDLQGRAVSRRYQAVCAHQPPEPMCATGGFTDGPDGPQNPNWTEQPVFLPPPGVAFRHSIRVRVTNQAGLYAEVTLPVRGGHRPRVVETAPVARVPAGHSGVRVRLTEVVPAEGPDITSDEITLLPYLDQLEPQLPPGLRLDVEQDAGRWYVFLTGEVQADAIGIYEFLLPIEQEPIGSGLTAPAVPVTVEVTSSADPGYRAILWHTQSGFQLIRQQHPPYVVDVAQRLEESSELSGFTPFTGSVRCTLSQGDVVVLDETCAPGSPFPWPADLPDSTYTATVEAHSADQTVTGEPYSTTFTLRALRPNLTVEPGPEAGGVTAQLMLYDLWVNSVYGVIEPPMSAHGYTIVCSVDGGLEHPCLDDGSHPLPPLSGQHHLRVTVTAPDGATAVREATWQGPAGAAVVTAGTPVILGEPRVGQILRADPGAWGPSTVRLTYQWLRDGVPVPGANSTSYPLDPTDLGTVVSVRVTGDADGLEPASALSAGVQVGPGMLASTRPKLWGTPQVGQRMRVSTPGWDPQAQISLQWLRNGIPIPGATGRSYQLTAADANRAVSVRAVGAAAGYQAVSRFSGRRQVLKGRLVTSRPRVIGVARPGRLLRARPGPWGPGGVRLEYQWRVDGAPVPGATASTFRVSHEDLGRTITVRIVGRLPGYENGVRTSRPVTVTAR